MKILYTSTTYPPCKGGAQALIHKTAQLFARNHGVCVVTHWDQNRSDWLLGTTLRTPREDISYAVDGVEVNKLGFSLKEKLKMVPFVASYYPLMPLALPRIARVIERGLERYSDGVDLIHNIRIGREGLSRASLDLARKKNVPFVLSPVHHPRWKTWRHREFIKIYREADAVISLSEGEKTLLVELGVDESRITVAGAGPFVEEHSFPAQFLARNGITGPFVLFLAQHFDYKGYRQLLQAMPAVWARFPDVHFVFMGTPVGGSEKHYELFAAETRVHRIVEVSPQEKTDALSACSVFCMPSLQESFGIVYVEAWCFNKPVIGCGIPSVASVIDNGVNGLLVGQDPNDIAEKICWLLDHPEQMEMMGRNGAAKAAGVYSWNRVMEKTEQAYRKAGCR
ncbi:MAG: glycosyltransferase family 4 protein [Kiritimatiellia bacterium]